MQKLGLAAATASASLIAAPALAGVTFNSAIVTADPYAAAGVGDDVNQWADQMLDSTVAFRDVSATSSGSAKYERDSAVIALATSTSTSAIAFVDAANGTMSATGSGSVDVDAEDAFALAGFGYTLQYRFTVDVASTLALDYANGHQFILIEEFNGQADKIAGGNLFGSGSRSFELAGGNGYTLIFSFGGANLVRQDGIGSGSGDRTTTYEFAITEGVVPEPAIWSMMITGFFLGGCALRRRPSQA